MQNIMKNEQTEKDLLHQLIFSFEHVDNLQNMFLENHKLITRI